MDMALILKAVAAVVIPFIITLLKKVKLPSKWAPVVAVLLATTYVLIARGAGLDADLNTVYAAIASVLGISGASVLGYDLVKKLTGK